MLIPATFTSHSLYKIYRKSKKSPILFCRGPGGAAAAGGQRGRSIGGCARVPDKKGADFCKSFSVFHLFKTFFVYIFYALLAVFVELLLWQRGKLLVFVHYHQKKEKTLLKKHLDK